MLVRDGITGLAGIFGFSMSSVIRRRIFDARRELPSGVFTLTDWGILIFSVGFGRCLAREIKYQKLKCKIAETRQVGGLILNGSFGVRHKTAGLRC